MKSTFVFAVSLVLFVWHFPSADCRVALTDPIYRNLTSDSPYPSYPSDFHTFNKTQKPSVPIGPRAIQIDPSEVKDEEILQISELLYNKEISLQDQVSVNVQGKTRSVDTNDQAPDPLMTVNEKVLNLPIIVKLRKLFNHFVMDTAVAEVMTAKKLQEQDDFLESILATNVMRQAMQFLQSKGIVTSDQRSQKVLLKTIWFTIYNRGQGAAGSSGFEHVFMNEVNRGKIIGLHNWVYFSEEEKAGRLDYKGWINKIDLGTKGKILEVRFTHNGLSKPVNTMFVGTSPELEMALYTICFQLRGDKLCPLSLGGKKFSIQSYIWRFMGNNMIGSAYPKI